MKNRTRLVLLALIAVVALILVIALLRGCQQGTGAPDATVDPEMPMDTSTLQPGEASWTEPAESGEAQPNIDPESGIELEEDELPIVTG